MKLVCSQAELSASLQLVSRAVASRPTHPVLANVLLTADAGTGRLSLTGFDLSLGIQTSLAAAVESSGAVTLPAKMFGEIVSRLSSDSPITLNSDEGSEQVDLTSSSGTYQMRGMPADDFPDLPLVQSGEPIRLDPQVLVKGLRATLFASSSDEAKQILDLTSSSGTYQMRGMPAEDFPDLPLVQSGEPIRLDPQVLVKGLRATLFASSSDEAKQILTGVHLGLDGQGLECAATDGHRLAVLKLDHALPEQGLPEGAAASSVDVTVPARSLRELERLLSARQSAEPVSLFCDRGQVVFLWSDQVLTSRSLDGNYPNYRQLIPESFSRQLQVDRRALISALERVAVLADQHNNVVKIVSDPGAGQLLISADAQDVGSGSESLAAVVTGEAIQIAFNVRYLLDGLKAITADQVELHCNAPTTPVILVPVAEPGFTYLVMPVQIRS